MTAAIAAPMIQTAINAEMVSIDWGGDGKVSEARFNQIMELADWYARKCLATS